MDHWRITTGLEVMMRDEGGLMIILLGGIGGLRVGLGCFLSCSFFFVLFIFLFC